MAAARWPAVLDGCAAAGVVETTPFFDLFSSFYSTPPSYSISKLKIPKRVTYCSRSTKKVLYFLRSFESDLCCGVTGGVGTGCVVFVGLVLGRDVVVCLEYGSVLCC